MRVLVVGASGCIGSPLCDSLVAEGHEVTGLSRSPGRTDIPWIRTDLRELTTLEGYDVAYYLVHSLDRLGYTGTDRALAQRFARLAARHGVRVVYLGSLGDGRLSRHIASRHEVGRILRDEADTAEVRAPMVVAADSVSFQALRFSAEHFPAYMSIPRHTPLSQPIALSDALAYLRVAADMPPGVYEIGGGDVLSYRELLERCPGWNGDLSRRRFITIRPYMIPLGSVILSRGLSRPLPTMAALLASLTAEMCVRDPTLMDNAGFTPLGYLQALDEALDERVGA